MRPSQPNDRQLREAAVEWFLQLRDRPNDPQLKAHFDQWLHDGEKNSKAYERVRCLMGDASVLLAKDETFLVKASQKAPPKNISHIIAAILLVVFGAGIYFPDTTTWLRADYVSGTAERMTVNAPDGSILSLNADTAIALKYSEKERRLVLMRGEVFIEVAGDLQRPFTVDAGGGLTTALGTAFDVNLRDDKTSITVVRHRVAVRTDSGQQAVILQENQQVDYSSDGQLSTVATVDSVPATAWRNNRLQFEDLPLSDVIEDLERYLPGKIVVQGEKVRHRRVSGNLDLVDPNEAIDTLALAFDINVTRISPYLIILH
nr:FecR domain-containing protein [Agrobacterium rosae]